MIISGDTTHWRWWREKPSIKTAEKFCSRETFLSFNHRFVLFKIASEKEEFACQSPINDVDYAIGNKEMKNYVVRPDSTVITPTRKKQMTLFSRTTFDHEAVKFSRRENLFFVLLFCLQKKTKFDKCWFFVHKREISLFNQMLKH